MSIANKIDALKTSITITSKDSTPSDTMQISKSHSATELVELDGRKELFKLLTCWSNWIIAWISIFIFHICLTLAIGLKWLDFTNNLGEREIK